MISPSNILLCFLAALLPCPASAQAADSTQQLRNPLLLGARWHYGFIIPHSRDIANVAVSHPQGVEINVQWLLAQEKHTRNSGVLAKRGLVVHYVDFDNPEVLGHCFSVAPYVEPLIRPWGRLSASVQMGLGLTWLSKLYDGNNNPTNLFFSSRISMLAMTNAYVHYSLSRHLDISLGFNYNHISNGGMKLPNKGMNFPTYNVGVNYIFQPVALQKPVKNDDWKKAKRHFATLLSVATIKTLEATDAFPDNEFCWQTGALFVAGRRVGRLSALSLGTEWIYDGYAHARLKREGLDKSGWKAGVLFGHELVVNRVRFTVHLAAYVFNPTRGTDDAVYQRYGLYYRFGRHVLFGSTLKAHRHVADVFDMRLGWIW